VRADFFLTCREDKNRARVSPVSTNRAFENNILKHYFQNFRIVFYLFFACTTLNHPHLSYSILILKKSILSEQFFNAILQLIQVLSILSNLPLFSVGVLFVLCFASFGGILYFDRFSGSCGFFNALFRSKSCFVVSRLPNREFESKNYKHENTCAGDNF
jgi:hypothetical protein